MTTHQDDFAGAMVQPIDFPEDPSAQGDSGALAIRNLNPIHHVKATLSVRVGEVELSVGDLVGARTGQVFALDRKVDQAVDLILEGSVVARGELVAVGDHFGIRVIELPLNLRPLA